MSTEPDPGESVAESVVDVGVVRFGAQSRRADRDAVAREEPLEIQIGGTPLAVVMRTPGHDAELALGFLLSERVIAAREDVLSVRHCREVRGPEAADNVVRVVLAEGVSVDWEALRRNLYASSSCGVCGKATIDNALACAPPVDDASRFTAAFFPPLPDRLAAAQPGFARTGGLHAAGLFDAAGRLLAAREDVGRHNAVDKVLGWTLARRRWPLSGHALLVSGRISFEIVQKALAARIPVVAGVSAPSSLAIALAERAGIALVGFLRGSAFNVYGHASRVQASRSEPKASEGHREVSRSEPKASEGHREVSRSEPKASEGHRE
ncbi:MAG TPA: formate dehydrogenase accessory sulfurtransferase FdhD, partial [Myxococcota bacterium]|nr:formate dehydrogenase accessory sulfurtransferase FdhD [Myxococcota bacterium]